MMKRSGQLEALMCIDVANQSVMPKYFGQSPVKSECVCCRTMSRCRGRLADPDNLGQRPGESQEEWDARVGFMWTPENCPGEWVDEESTMHVLANYGSRPRRLDSERVVATIAHPDRENWSSLTKCRLIFRSQILTVGVAGRSAPTSMGYRTGQ
jgi:hypothetical protein